MSSTPVTANGASATLVLLPGENLISVEATTVATGATFVVQTQLEGGQWTEHKDPQDSATPARLDDADSVSGGGYARQFTVSGPGAVRVYAANISTSTGVILRAVKSSIS